jgi:hypothetical protein
VQQPGLVSGNGLAWVKDNLTEMILIDIKVTPGISSIFDSKMRFFRSGLTPSAKHSK